MRPVLFSIVFLILITFCLSCGKAFRAGGEGMRPTITSDDMCVTDAYTTADRTIKRFDIVIFKLPVSETQRGAKVVSDRQVKRVIGLPGETLELKDNQLYVDEQLMNEPFERITSETDQKRNFGPVRIPEDEYFVLGDNRPNSSDSRYYQPTTIKRADIFSKVVEIKKDYYAGH